MKKLLNILLLITCVSNNLFAQACDLFFSEYVEGSSYNKYIEVYNGTGAAVNLSDYRIDLFTNGSATPSTSNTLSGTLANNSVIVYANANATIYTGSVTVLSAVNFNGDDAIGLYKISSGTYVDVFGNIGCDPGSAWSSGGNSTKDHTLIRDATVCCGVGDTGNSPCDFPTLSTEWTGYPQDDTTELGRHTSNCGCTPAAEPTSNTSAAVVSVDDCNYTAGVSLTTGNGTNRIVVISTSPITDLPVDQTHYNADSAFGMGDSIGVGEYVVYNGSGNSLNIDSLYNNTTYYFAVFEYNGSINNCEENYLTTGFYTDSFSVVCTCPEIKTIMVNTCGPSNQEGNDEYVKVNTEGSDVYLDSISVTFPNGGTFCNNGCGANTIVNNAAYINQLNTTAGCSLFTYSNVVPASSELIIFTGNPPNFNYDFSADCGSGPIYVAFANNSSGTGRFANAADGNRTLSINFNSTCADSATYYSSAATTGIDGDYAIFDNLGNATYANNGACIVPLPLQIISFTGVNHKGQNILQWNYLDSTNVNSVLLLKADGKQPFERIAEFSPQKNKIQYFTDDAPFFDGTYYQLQLLDANGKTISTKTIIVSSNPENEITVYPNPVKSGGEINILYRAKSNRIHISLYDITGRKISDILNTSANRLSGSSTIVYRVKVEKGIYFLKFYDGDTVQTQKIVAY